MKQLCKRKLNHLKDMSIGLDFFKHTSNAMEGKRSRISKDSQKVKTPLSAVSQELLLVEEHIRPLIKEELRHSIQSKRIAKGLPSIVSVNFNKPNNDVSLYVIF